MTGIVGVILAGGTARRMGGGDKGRLDLGGTSLLAEVIRRLTPQCDALVLNANGAAGRFADLGLEVVADSIADHPGPLAGILAGMDHAAQRGASHIVSAAADTPFLPPDLVPRLQEAAKASGLPIALAATRQRDRLQPHPTFGLWPVALREDLRTALGNGMAKVRHWAGQHGATLAEFPHQPRDPFFNVNTPEDLAIARLHWSELTR